MEGILGISQTCCKFQISGTNDIGKMLFYGGLMILPL
jgi:hypothetical protein